MDFTSRPSKITINLAYMAHNFSSIRKYVAGTKVMAVVKANAYGHGLLKSAFLLEKAGADYFGVALLEEGMQLRAAGIKTPIHVFGGILSDQISEFILNDLELTASSISKLQQIDLIADKLGARAKVHIKIDTGMGRIGVKPETAYQLIRVAAGLNNIDVKGIFSHFACSDDSDPAFTKKQLNDFLPLVSFAKQELGQEILAHISNSAALLKFPEANLDMVRPGLIIYGVYPDSTFENTLNLKPALNVTSKIVYFKVVREGQSVSYSRSWIAAQDSRVVTVPVGYGDGYLRSLSNKTSVLINGKRYPNVGKICMDQFMVSIGDDSAYNQDKVILIGADGNEQIRVEELAELAGTVPHEILSNLNLRLPREYETV